MDRDDGIRTDVRFTLNMPTFRFSCQGSDFTLIASPNPGLINLRVSFEAADSEHQRRNTDLALALHRTEKKQAKFGACCLAAR